METCRLVGRWWSLVTHVRNARVTRLELIDALAALFRSGQLSFSLEG